MKITTTLLLLCCSALVHAEQTGSHFAGVNGGPNGLSVSCSNILVFASQYKNYMPSSIVLGERLSDWTPETSAFLKGAADYCGKSYNPKSIDAIKQAIDQVAAIPQQQKDAEALQLAATKNSESLRDCEQTKDSRLYEAEETIIQTIEGISGWKDRILQERRISRAAGVRNLANEYENAKGQIDAQDSLRGAWDYYKELGGKAKSPQLVKHRSEDICSKFRGPAAS
jgi:hypothetical protein